MLSLSKSFVWIPDCSQAFNSMKAFCDTPVLAAPDFLKSFKLDVEAGAVLLQEDTSGVVHTGLLFFVKTQQTSGEAFC